MEKNPDILGGKAALHQLARHMGAQSYNEIGLGGVPQKPPIH
jgi:hypothetical protein